MKRINIPRDVRVALLCLETATKRVGRDLTSSELMKITHWGRKEDAGFITKAVAVRSAAVQASIFLYGVGALNNASSDLWLSAKVNFKFKDGEPLKAEVALKGGKKFGAIARITSVV